MKDRQAKTQATSTMVARGLALAATTDEPVLSKRRHHSLTSSAAAPTRSSIPLPPGYHYPDNLPEGHPGHYYPGMPPYPVIAP